MIIDVEQKGLDLSHNSAYSSLSTQPNIPLLFPIIYNLLSVCNVILVSSHVPLVLLYIPEQALINKGIYVL